jgi:hypothetical protein
VGFEPTEPGGSTVFETVRFGRSRIPPGAADLLFCFCGEDCSGKCAWPLDLAHSRWLSEGTSPSTIHHCHRVLATCLHQAQRWGLIDKAVTVPSESINSP